MQTGQREADGVFLKAFDTTIQQVYQDLTLSGLNDTVIWAAFKRATTLLAEFSSDVEEEVYPVSKSKSTDSTTRGRRPASGE